MRKLLFLALLCPFLSNCQLITIKGKIINEQNLPVANATITIKHTSKTVISDANGSFTISNSQFTDTLIVSAVGYQTTQEPNNERGLLTIILKRKTSLLDEAIIIAYGATTKRGNTAAISRVSAQQISTQPVSNPLSVLQGLIPGLVVSQRTGLPGSNFTVQLRGINSLKQGTQPLFIIDGVPFMLNTGSLSQLVPDVQSIFNTIAPSSIESIEVLKDADATAIYGSQGANGVVLITTKKGKPGPSKFDFNYYTGFGKASRGIALLNTQQYLQMRREAFANDAVVPTVSNAPDLMLWDSSAYTNWQKQLIGGTARTNNYTASLSGGSGTVSYLVSANYYNESTVFPQSLPSTRSSVNFSLSHFSANKKFTANFSAFYSVDEKDRPFTDLSSFILLPPNAPPLYDSAGHLKWSPGLDNPLAYLLETYQTRMSTLMGNASFQYHLFAGASVSFNLGYNTIRLNEQKQAPIAALRPSSFATGSLRLTSGNTNSWLAEPLFNYKASFAKQAIQFLLGSSFQQRIQASSSVLGSGFTNDDLIANISAAATLTASNAVTEYKYAAVFSRFSYSYNRRYMLNINLRRDGSSRYGPANRFANFGAAGMAWLFSEEKFFQRHLSFISYGKLRGSYGLTGNDQVGDYQFFDSWSPSSTYLYNGVSGILPSRLFNANYQWEKNKKLEAAVELGFLDDRLLFTAAYYRNRSSSQLVFYKLPSQTGFTSILRNIDALIQNSGTEWELTAKLIRTKNFTWQSYLNLSVPRNKLIAYPGLETSTDKLNYAVGQPVSITRTFTYLGVDTATGLYSFIDVDGDGKISSPNDLTNIAFIGPKYFGGWQNNFSYKNWQLSFLFYGMKQTGRNYLAGLTTAPGLLSNQPSWVLNRWQTPGELADVQRFTALAFSTVATAFSRYRSSSALISDASFIRLRNLSLSYSLPKAVIKKAKLQNLRIYVEGQNLFTITSYKGADPETQNLLALPPLKILAAGIQLTL